eukprot:CAMPEP_0198315884 /NCGR_PEP_ID=MMETSP1450-20131203/5983_1 /TAXON_ID=753684 ORGANISM="Madagascaria erythrocladiodes, Strain CCMP3234" /NCGR_SAMPLE_ID=MMETSP1450 /ASSEMBLY_ACC=CAM_ASM_001115 /LENGTH=294 /DNA_ID=CAMNT_0044019011 /DNA_START=36 /DNA_END=920 /DNA_ORIENTATION=+
MTKRAAEADAETAAAASASAKSTPAAVAAEAVQAADVVTRDVWLQRRKELLAAEKQWTRRKDELAAQRRALGMVLVDNPYSFEASDDSAKHTLAELFGDEHNQLIVYHLMYADNYDDACKRCSFLLDHLRGVLPHLEQKARFVAVAAAAPTKLAELKQRKQWPFAVYSSRSSTFNRDYGVEFSVPKTDTITYNYNDKHPSYGMSQWPGLSVFAKRADGTVYHAYSTYGRGLDILLGTYNLIDLTPAGRNEAGAMSWVQHVEQYGGGGGGAAGEAHSGGGGATTTTAAADGADEK